MVCANTVLETGELRIRVTDNQMNSRILQLIELMKKSEENKKTKQRYFIKMADKVVKYNFLGAGLTYLLTGSFSKANFFPIGRFLLRFENLYSCSLFNSYQGGVES